MPRRNALPTDECDGLLIADCSDDAGHAAGNADEIERGTVCKSVRRHKAQPAIAGHGSIRFGDNVGRRMRQPGENLQWAGKIEPRQISKNYEAEIEIRHAVAPFASGYAARS